MIKPIRLLLAVAAMLAVFSVEATEPNYTLAEQFSPKKMKRLVPQSVVRPNWFENSSKFWYKWQTVDAINYYMVDPATGKRTELWSQRDLAEKVTDRKSVV